MSQPLDYQTPSPNPGRLLRLPAILLITFGGLTLFAIFLDFFTRLAGDTFRFTFGLHVGPPETTMCFNGLSIPLLILMIVGAVQMLKLRHYTLALTSAILAVIPFTATCCCIFTLPIGIWALILLRRADVKAAFNTLP